MTFSERLVHVAIFWGIPMVCLELIGIPIAWWAFMLIFTIPATLLGVLVYTAIEHWFYTTEK
jgi:hypothetical protein